MTTGHGHAAVVPVGRRAPGFEVPASLARDVADDAEQGPARRAWLEALPGTVADLADRWSLEVGQPSQPGGNASWVAPAAGTCHRRTAAFRRSRASTGAKTTQPTWSSRPSSQFGTARTSHPA